jgi:hypothetical protein
VPHALPFAFAEAACCVLSAFMRAVQLTSEQKKFMKTIMKVVGKFLNGYHKKQRIATEADVARLNKKLSYRVGGGLPHAAAWHG